VDNPRSEKVAVVDEVRQHFSDSDAAILTEYRGLKVKEMAELRRSLTPAGGQYKVYKNTLVRFAARDAGLEGLDALLEGPTAVAFIKGDAAAAAKALRDFSRTQPLLVIKGGVLGDKILSVAETTALADLPSREVLLARLAGAIAAPMQQMAGLLQALPRNLAYGLAALRDQKVDAGEGADAPAGITAEAPVETEAAPVETEAAPAEEAVAGPDEIVEAATAEPPAETTAVDDAAGAVLADEAADPAPSE
jgi:large subunit ribosomal protein L10